MVNGVADRVGRDFMGVGDLLVTFSIICPCNLPICELRDSL